MSDIAIFQQLRDHLTARNIRSAHSSFFRAATFVTYLLRLRRAHNSLQNNWF